MNKGNDLIKDPQLQEQIERQCYQRPPQEYNQQDWFNSNKNQETKANL